MILVKRKFTRPVNLQIVLVLNATPLQQTCDPERPMTFCCNPGDRRRWEIALRDGEDKESVSSVDSVWKLIGPHVTPSNAELERRAIYTVGTKLQGDDG